MKTSKLFTFLTIGLMTLAVTSCSNNDDVVLTQPDIMANQTVKGEDCIVKINSYARSGCTATFTPQSEDNLTMKLSIEGLRPDKAVDIDVNVVPDEGQLKYSGSVEQDGSTYTITGTFANLWRNEWEYQAPRARINVDYVANAKLSEKEEYSVTFNNSTVQAVGGQTADYITNVAKMMGRNYAEDYSSLKLNFSNDGMLNVTKQPADAASEATTLNTRYWNNADGKTVCVELTAAQAEDFYKLWTGDISKIGTLTSVLTESANREDCYILTLGYKTITAGTLLYISPATPNRTAFELYSEGKGKAFANDEEKADMQTLLDNWSTENDLSLGIVAQ